MSELQEYLSHLNASITDRKAGVEFFHKHPEAIPQLFEWATHGQSERVHVISAWIFEMYVMEDIDRLTPYWQKLLDRMPSLTNESIRRPLSKICYNYLKTFEDQISDQQKDSILSTAFDWLTEPAAVATQNFAMKSLYLLRDHQHWVQEQLVAVVKSQYPTGSPGYKSAARQILKL